ncbi:OLC1v1038139C1 [Oldenlandia corymbosa var. corymbosa]|uniref:OLC1v1038139C1 n=1 Tax=Oldenlandia corymbosa var. corymbosa TaxID=529605 RepID=A0AAV1D283_OLDCO|nr:OLC1v1038139C1 [Oldenlandia corymbosa var. corymbosa]
MAGMLPGVEVARRRRFHLSRANGTFDSPSPSSSSVTTSTRRSSFCLYPSNHESHLISSIPTMQRSPMIDAYCNDQKLVDAAREAKKRLDGRLRAQWKPESKRGLRNNNSQRPRRDELETRPIEQQEREEVEVTPSAEICELRKSGSKRFGWPKFGWKTSEQDECAVCLEKYKVGENLMQLQCGHRYHSRCLVPWLENKSHCPCCRTELV